MAGVTSDIIQLKEVRLSFARLFTPKAFRQGQTPRYEATFLMDPSRKDHAKMISTIKKTAKEILSEYYGGADKIPVKKLEYCFGDADDDGIEYDGYAGMFYIRTSNQTKPKILDRNKAELDEASGRPYSGCYVNTNITLWVMDNDFGKRVNCNLRIVQFNKDSTAFGAKPAEAEEMDIVDIDDDDGVDDGGFLDD